MAMNKALLVGIIVAGALIVALFAFRMTGYAVAPTAPAGNLDNFATCLTDSGATMYGASWCGHCKDQKKEFGSSWNLVNYVECSSSGNGGQTEACKVAGIKGYPTWVFGDGTRLEGEASMKVLSQKTGCTLS